MTEYDILELTGIAQILTEYGLSILGEDGEYANRIDELDGKDLLQATKILFGIIARHTDC